MVKKNSLLREIPEELILNYLDNFKGEHPEIFRKWISIEKKDMDIEIDELSLIGEEVRRFISENSELSNHTDILSVWMAMRSIIRDRELSLPTYFRSTDND